MKNHKLIASVVVIAVVVALAVALFLYVLPQNIAQPETIDSEFDTVFLEQKTLRLYETFEGTLEYDEDIKIVATKEGILTYLASEGQELGRGAELYRIYRSIEPSQLLEIQQQISSSEASVAQAELALENLTSPATAAQIASADTSVAQAELALENLTSPATAAQIASADTAIAQAELALENLTSPATAAQIASADTSVAQAELALENLTSPATAAQIASADTAIAQAELALENLTSPATAAQIASADTSVAQAQENLTQGENTITSMTASRLIARQSLCKSDKLDQAAWICPWNFRAQPFPDNLEKSLLDMITNNLLSTEANNLLNAHQNYLESISSKSILDLALEQALKNRRALDEAPTDAELLQATLALQSAKEQRNALDQSPTDAELLQATLALQSAKEQRNALDQSPTDAELLQATLALQSAKEQRNALDQSPTDAELLQATLALQSAKEQRTALDQSPTDAELLQATLALQSAKEQRNALDQSPTDAELLQATLALQSAKEQRNALDQSPTDAELLQAKTSLESAMSSLRTSLNKRNELTGGSTLSILMFGNTPAWRDIKEGVTPGEDINQLEFNLIALGYGIGKNLGPDTTFDENTATAIRQLQSDLKVAITGEITLGEITFVPGTSMIRPSSTLHTISSKVNDGTELLSLTPIEKISSKIGPNNAVTTSGKSLQRVEIQIPVADRELMKTGSKVDIELPDESRILGTIHDIASFAVAPEEGDPFLDIAITVDGSTEYFEWTGASVTVHVTKELAENVLASPVNGLLALLSGGYALEIVTPTGTSLVPVETGIYADGWVQINGPGLKTGTEIIVPKQ